MKNESNHIHVDSKNYLFLLGCPIGVLCYAIGEEWTNPCGTYTCVGDRTPVFMASDGIYCVLPFLT